MCSMDFFAAFYVIFQFLQQSFFLIIAVCCGIINIDFIFRHGSNVVCDRCDIKDLLIWREKSLPRCCIYL